MYLIAKRSGTHFHLAYIPDDYDGKHEEEFDQNYMKALFSYAYNKAAKGYPWDNAPPGFSDKKD